MIDFMVIGAPRSGTAWTSNWLTNGADLCWHDVLFQTPIERIDDRYVANPSGKVGIADTGIWKFPDFLAQHPAKKVVLHRELSEINASLLKAGLPALSHNVWLSLGAIDGVHVDWRVLFTSPDFIYFHLFGRHMSDYEYRRHELLCKLNVQMDFEKVDPDPEVSRQMLERMRADVR